VLALCGFLVSALCAANNNVRRSPLAVNAKGLFFQKKVQKYSLLRLTLQNLPLSFLLSRKFRKSSKDRRYKT
jgi:hypothetical protein